MALWNIRGVGRAGWWHWTGIYHANMKRRKVNPFTRKSCWTFTLKTNPCFITLPIRTKKHESRKRPTRTEIDHIEVTIADIWYSTKQIVLRCGTRNWWKIIGKDATWIFMSSWRLSRKSCRSRFEVMTSRARRLNMMVRVARREPQLDRDRKWRRYLHQLTLRPCGNSSRCEQLSITCK